MLRQLSWNVFLVAGGVSIGFGAACMREPKMVTPVVDIRIKVADCPSQQLVCLENLSVYPLPKQTRRIAVAALETDPTLDAVLEEKAASDDFPLPVREEGRIEAP